MKSSLYIHGSALGSQNRMLITMLLFTDTMNSFTNHQQQPKRYLAYTACYSRCHTIQQVYEFLCNKLRFTREDMRLWKINPKDEVHIGLSVFVFYILPYT